MRLAVLVALLAGCAALAGAQAASAGPRRGSRSARPEPSNRAAAVTAAKALLRRTPVPRRARRASAEPAGDGHLLARPPGAPASRALIDRHVLYVSREPLLRAERFYSDHRPAGAHPIGHGTSSGPGDPANLNVTWSWPSAAAIVSRQTVIEMVALPGGATGIRIDAQVVYRVPRPAGEKVPAGVTEVDISRATPGHLPDLSRTVTRRRQVRAIVAMIDRLPIVQPAYIACPVLLAGIPVVTFSFRASATGPALATASEQADVTEPTTACNALMFATGTHPWPSLLHGARFLHRVDALLHARFATAPEAGPGPLG